MYIYLFTFTRWSICPFLSTARRSWIISCPLTPTIRRWATQRTATPRPMTSASQVSWNPSVVCVRVCVPKVHWSADRFVLTGLSHTAGNQADHHSCPRVTLLVRRKTPKSFVVFIIQSRCNLHPQTEVLNNIIIHYSSLSISPDMDQIKFYKWMQTFVFQMIPVLC